MLEPVGFWSYTRHDDEQSDGALSQLRVIVGKAIALQHGAEVTLWQDVTAIPFGADWAEAIDDTLSKTTFFMPIVTPRYLKSSNCCDEYTSFRRHMSEIGRNDLVFPIHYVGVEKMAVEDTVFGEHLGALRRHQWIDFRSHFYADPRSPEIKKWAGQLAESILTTLRRQPPPKVVPRQVEDFAPPPEEPRSYPGANFATKPEPPREDFAAASTAAPWPDTKAGSPFETPVQTPSEPESFFSAAPPMGSQDAGSPFGRGDAAPAPQSFPNQGASAMQPRPVVGAAGAPVPTTGMSKQRMMIAAAVAGLILAGGVAGDLIFLRPKPTPIPTPGPKLGPIATVIPTPPTPPAPAPVIPTPPAPIPAKVPDATPATTPRVLTNLGDRYYYGRGVPQDYAKALSYYEKAAAGGSGEAMNDVGELYFYGRGVPQNYTTASTWYEKAATAGNADGMTNLGSLYDVGYGVNQDYGKARDLYEKAAATGNPDAMVSLGWLFSVGRGVMPDASASAEWYKKAVASR